ncbi:MAG: recombinase family protein, partial [Ktedonobacterales bacterium]
MNALPASPHPKILGTHLHRQAVIYVRQSSQYQVETALESQRRQYHLAEWAEQLGWPHARCLVIDEDLGISGAHSFNRPGYQRLVSLVALRQVGIVLGLEVSRLARNSLDWYQLLELAAAFDVLIADEDGIYNPGDFNDRLLLGLKGTISEVELYQIKARMVRGRLHKAQRGELTWTLPVGLEYDSPTGQIRLAVDQSVRHALQRVFDLFGKLQSVRRVLTYLAWEGLELPSETGVAGGSRVVRWQAPRYHVVYRFLTNPLYAGIYAYGRRQAQVDPVAHRRQVVRRSRTDWEVFLPGHHPGYISPQDYEANLAMLEQNYNQFPANRGAVREGPTLLQGLVWCQHCGHKMRICYRAGHPYYLCDADHRSFGTAICNRASARRIDVVVEELVLCLLNPQTLQHALHHEQHLREEVTALERAWQDKLQRLRYQADLARRRYEAVDPANRLVAQTLETEWNARLVELEAAEHTYGEQRPTPHQLQSTLAQIQEVVSHLRSYWYQETISDREKKELVRCVIERVTLATHTEGKVIRAEICWQGGATSQVEVPKYLFSAPQLFYRISDLARQFPDGQIADQLNAEGLQTVKGRAWSARRVMDFRLSNGIASGFTVNPQLRLTAPGTLTSAEAATRLELRQTTVQKWYKLGLLPGTQAGNQAHLWITWTPDVEQRLGGQASFDPRMVSLKRLCRERGQTWEQVVQWCLAEGHQIYRLRRGTTFRFYV